MVFNADAPPATECYLVKQRFGKVVLLASGEVFALDQGLLMGDPVWPFNGHVCLTLRLGQFMKYQ
jgi:hypothetical protein